MIKLKQERSEVYFVFAAEQDPITMRIWGLATIIGYALAHRGK